MARPARCSQGRCKGRKVANFFGHVTKSVNRNLAGETVTGSSNCLANCHSQIAMANCHREESHSVR